MLTVWERVVLMMKNEMLGVDPRIENIPHRSRARAGVQYLGLNYTNLSMACIGNASSPAAAPPSPPQRLRAACSSSVPRQRAGNCAGPTTQPHARAGPWLARGYQSVRRGFGGNTCRLSLPGGKLHRLCVGNSVFQSEYI